MLPLFEIDDEVYLMEHGEIIRKGVIVDIDGGFYDKSPIKVKWDDSKCGFRYDSTFMTNGSYSENNAYLFIAKVDRKKAITPNECLDLLTNIRDCVFRSKDQGMTPNETIRSLVDFLSK